MNILRSTQNSRIIDATLSQRQPGSSGRAMSPAQQLFIQNQTELTNDEIKYINL